MHIAARYTRRESGIVEAMIWITIVVSVSSSSILVLLSNADAEACAFWRTFIAGLLTLAYKLVYSGKKRGQSICRRDVMLSIASGFFLALHLLLWMKSLFFVPISVSTTVVDTYPLMTVIADILLGEKPTIVQITGLILGFTGVVMFMQPWVLGEYNPYGVILAFLGAIAEAVYFTLGRIVRRRMSLVSYTAYVYNTSSMTLLAYSISIGSNLYSYPLTTYIYFLLLAIIPTIGGHTLINYLLRYRKTSVATSIVLCEPIGASIMASIIFEQIIDTSKIFCMALTLTSTAIVIFSGRKARTEKAYNP